MTEYILNSLRIATNRNLKDLDLVDHSALYYSFGIEDGIPILSRNDLGVIHKLLS